VDDFVCSVVLLMIYCFGILFMFMFRHYDSLDTFGYDAYICYNMDVWLLDCGVRLWSCIMGIFCIYLSVYYCYCLAFVWADII